MKRPVIQTYRKPAGAGQYPDGTVAEAGFLVSDSAGWRSRTPVLSEERCTGCLRCYLVCPDACIGRREKKVTIDERFCKGCGICAAECAAGAITMKEEKE